MFSLKQPLPLRKGPPRTPTLLPRCLPGQREENRPLARLLAYLMYPTFLPVASGFLTGHAAAAVVIVHAGAVTWGLRKQPRCSVSLILKPRLLFQKSLWVVLFEGMFYKCWAFAGSEPNPSPVKFTSLRGEQTQRLRPVGTLGRAVPALGLCP